MQPGAVTTEATAAYAARFAHYQMFYRQAQGLTLSSLGLGTYLGERSPAADRAYVEAIHTALASGINVLDTSLNYRQQNSERNLGEALAAADLPRQAYLVCTKAGFLVPGAVPLGVLRAIDIVGNMHCMAPAFLEDQLERSRRNLRLETVDVFYLHNPETQLRFVSREEFLKRMEAAFACLEAMVGAGRIRFYGTATWDGYRRNGMPDGLSLEELASLAGRVGGPDHHFRFIQLPFNLAMTEAFGQRAETAGGEKVSVLEAAARHGITVIASAALLQARLASGLPEQLAQLAPGATSDAVRAIQFARSAPGLTTALVGMGQAAHVRENLGITAIPPIAPESFARLFS